MGILPHPLCCGACWLIRLFYVLRGVARLWWIGRVQHEITLPKSQFATQEAALAYLTDRLHALEPKIVDGCYC